MKKIILLTILFSNYTHAEENFTISPGKVGCIEIGNSVDELYKKCGKNLVELFNSKRGGAEGEQTFSLSANIYLNKEDKAKNKPSFMIDIEYIQNQKIIYRATIINQKFKTKEGIGAGSSYSEVVKKYKGDLTISSRFVTIKSLGVTFTANVLSKDFRTYLETDTIPPHTKMDKEITLTDPRERNNSISCVNTPKAAENFAIKEFKKRFYASDLSKYDIRTKIIDTKNHIYDVEFRFQCPKGRKCIGGWSNIHVDRKNCKIIYFHAQK